jgi:hypothetical protein
MIWVSHDISNFRGQASSLVQKNYKNLNTFSEVLNHNNMKIKEILIFGALTRRFQRVPINFAMSLWSSVLYYSLTVSVLRFLQWCGWCINTSGMWHCVTAFLVPDITRQQSGITFKGLTIHKIKNLTTLEDENIMLSWNTGNQILSNAASHPE